MQYKLLFAALAAAQLTLAAPVPAPEEGIYSYYAPIPKEKREEGIYSYYAPIPKEKREAEAAPEAAPEEVLYTSCNPRCEASTDRYFQGIYTYYATPKEKREAEAAPEPVAEEVGSYNISQVSCEAYAD